MCSKQFSGLKKHSNWKEFTIGKAFTIFSFKIKYYMNM